MGMKWILSLALAGVQPAFADMKDDLEREVRRASPSRLVRLINSGWSSSMKPLARGLKSDRSYIALHATEPAMIMDLRTADGFRESFLNQALSEGGDADIGHVWISWRCHTKKGIVEGASGQVGNLNNQFMDMVKKGWGLAAFKSHYTDGYLETPQIIQMEELRAKEIFHTLVVEVDPAVCGKAMGFVETYVNHPSQPHKHYGLEGNPFQFQGGGCGSFGLAVSEVAGIFGEQKVSENFWRTLIANPDLFGYGLPHRTDVVPYKFQTEGQRKISLTKVLSTNWNGSRAGVDPQLTIMDPEMLLLSMKTIYRLKMDQILKSGGLQLQKLFESKKPGNLLNYRITSGQDKKVIDENYDGLAEATVRQTKSWMDANNFQSRVLWIGKNPAVVLEKIR